VASIPSIEPLKTFDEYAIGLSNYWGVGNADKDDGLTFFFSKGLRQMRISSGYGTRNIISDAQCQEVLNSIVIPQFKNGEFYPGVRNALLELIKIWNER